MVRVKTGHVGQGQDHAKTRADSEWQRGWQSRLGLDAEQGHVRQNQNPCRTALGQAQDRALLGKGQCSAGYDR